MRFYPLKIPILFILLIHYRFYYYLLLPYKYTEKQVRLSSTPVSQLVEYFNNEVGSRAWNSERAAFNAALIDALIHKGVDVTDIYDGKSISFKKKITYDSTSKRLVSIA